MYTFFNALVIALFFGALLSVTPVGSVAAGLYKHVNPDGSVEFTDFPRSTQDKPVILSPMSTFTPTPVPPVRSTPQKTAGTTQYTAANITSPANEATIRDNTGKLTIKTSVTPSLQPGHKIVLLNNGEKKGESTTGFFELNNVDRGAHILTIQVQDSTGKTLISSQAVTVFLHRRSSIRP